MSRDDIENRAFELAEYRLQVAREDLEVAKDNFGRDYFRAANNRAYYFYLPFHNGGIGLRRKGF